VLLANVTPFDSCIFFDWLLQRFKVQTAVTDSKLEREALEELIGAQALSADLKTAILACLSGTESRRWTIAELLGRLNKLGVHCSKPAVAGALAELALEISLCPFLPWSLVEHGTEWSLTPKSDLLELLSGVRKLPGISSGALTDEHKAVLLVVIGYRRKGGVSRTRIGEILGLEAAPYLEDLRKKELVYTAPGKELELVASHPGGAPGAGLALRQ
jgi:chromosome segregation and condensation protein ScpB